MISRADTRPRVRKEIEEQLNGYIPGPACNDHDSLTKGRMGGLSVDGGK
jgi:hypothetical protein